MRTGTFTINRSEMKKDSFRFILMQSHLQMAFILLFSGLYIIRDLVGISFPDIIFSGLCAIAFFLLDHGPALGVYVFTAALTVPHNEIGIFYICFFCLKFYREKKLRFKASMFIMTVMLLVLQMVDMLLYMPSSLTVIIYEYIVKMLYVIVPMVWYMLDISPEDYKNAMLSYMWGALLGGAIVVILTGNQVGWTQMLQGNKFMRIGALVESDGAMQSTYNPNQLGGMMVLVFSMTLVLVEKKKLLSIVGWMVCGIALVITALTRSRTGILCLAGVAFLYWIYIVFISHRYMKGLLFPILLLILLLLALYIEPSLFDGLMSRFTEAEDISNGRVDLFSVYMQEWMSNLWVFLFGYGILSFQYVVDAVNVPHNAITDVLICWGLTGFILVASTLVSFYLCSIRKLNKHDRFLASIPAAVALIMSMAGQYITTGFPHMRLCFLLLAIQALAPDEQSGYLGGDR